MIPKHFEIRLPALKLLNENQELQMRQFEPFLAQIFGLTDEEIQEEYESGNGRVFYYRISWALSYLNSAGLVARPRRAVYQITELGRKMLKKPGEIDLFIAEAMAKMRGEKPSKKASVPEAQPELTPQEELYTTARRIQEARYDELIETVLSKTPREFENLVVLLLQRMGYGGEVKEAGQVTPYSNDGGIDGIIKEDVLGFGRVHIQAKRYAREISVGRVDVQNFVGALASVQSNKGVFITTSTFAKSAREYANNLRGETKIVLIDGLQLAQYLYEYNIGVQVEHSVVIKKLDSDFWDALQDDP